MGVTFGRKGSFPLRWSREKDYTHIEAREGVCFLAVESSKLPVNRPCLKNRLDERALECQKKSIT
jgi:hypothetical protein